MKGGRKGRSRRKRGKLSERVLWKLRERKAQTEFLFDFPIVKEIRSGANDNEILLYYQYQYVWLGHKSALSPMYLKAKEVALHFVLSIAHKNGYVTRSRELQEEFAHRTAWKVIENFMTKQQFHIRKNFPAYIYFCLLRVMFYKNKIDRATSFDSSLFEEEAGEARHFDD